MVRSIVHFISVQYSVYLYIYFTFIAFLNQASVCFSSGPFLAHSFVLSRSEVYWLNFTCWLCNLVPSDRKSGQRPKQTNKSIAETSCVWRRRICWKMSSKPKLLSFLSSRYKVDKEWQVSVCVALSVEFLGGESLACGGDVMQPGLYGQTLPIDGKMREGAGLNSEEKRSSCVGISLSCRHVSQDQGRTAETGGHRRTCASTDSRGRAACWLFNPSWTQRGLMPGTRRTTMSYLNVGVAFFEWWCVGKGGCCTTVKKLNCSITECVETSTVLEMSSCWTKQQLCIFSHSRFWDDNCVEQ